MSIITHPYALIQSGQITPELLLFVTCVFGVVILVFVGIDLWDKWKNRKDK